MTVIGLVGHTGSGKSLVARILAERHGAVVYRHSEFLKAAADTFGLPLDALTLGRIWSGLASQFGETFLTERVCALITEEDRSPSRLEVVDGIRLPPELARYRQLPDFALVQVRADQDIRFARVRNRGNRPGEDGMSWEHFLEIEHSAPHRHVDALLREPGYSLDANGTVEEFIPAVEAVYRQIMTDLVELRR